MDKTKNQVDWHESIDLYLIYWSSIP